MMKSTPPVALQPHQFQPELPPVHSATSTPSIIPSKRSQSPALRARPSSGSRKPSKPTAAAVSPTAGVEGTTPVYEAYVNNLKEQIQVLELELKYVRENAGKQAEAMKVADSVVPTKLAASLSTLHASSVEIARCERIDAEVRDLKAHFARREVEHTTEVAQIRQDLAAAKEAVRSAEETAIHKAQVEMDGRLSALEEYHSVQRSSLVQENIKLQKTIERIALESKTRDIELLNVLRTKETQLRELLDTKEALRTIQGKAEILMKQLEESQSQVRSWQDQHRTLEAKEREVRAQLALTQTDNEQRWTERVSRLEEQVRNLTKELSEKTLQCERAELLSRQAEQRVSSSALLETQNLQLIDKLRQQIQESDAKIAQLTAISSNVTAERDYFKVTSERLQSDLSLANVKTTNLQKQLTDEGQTLATVERNHRATIAELETLRRELTHREQTYKTMEQRDEELRRHLRVVELDNNSLREEALITKTQNEKLQTSLVTQNRLVDQLKGECNIAEVSRKLEQTRGELNSLLHTQLHLNNDVTTLVSQLNVSAPALMAPLGDPNATQQSIDLSQASPSFVTRSPPKEMPPASGAPESVTFSNSDVLREIAELQAKIKLAEAGMSQTS